MLVSGFDAQSAEDHPKRILRTALVPAHTHTRARPRAPHPIHPERALRTARVRGNTPNPPHLRPASIHSPPTPPTHPPTHPPTPPQCRLPRIRSLLSLPLPPIKG